MKKIIRTIHSYDETDHIVEEYEVNDFEDNPNLKGETIGGIKNGTLRERKFVPSVEHKLRTRLVIVPEAIYKCSGIKVLGKRIKSLLFTTDIAIISNSNADAVMAVYPFTPQLSITQAIINSAPVPVLAGVGGGLTTGIRSLNVAMQAELMGAYGVVVNAPIENHMINELSTNLDIPVVATIVSKKDDYVGKIKAGARILNVSGGKNTAELVREIRTKIGPDFPIIATGGPTEKSIEETIEAGANAITYTPPTSAEIFANVMEDYRKK